VPNTAVMVASSDEHFREMVRDSLVNLPEAKIVAEYQEVSANLYIRVLQDLDRHPNAGLIVDISGDPDGSIKAVEKVKQAVPDLFVMVSNFHADGETVIQCMRAGANEFLMQPLKRTEFRDAMGRLERHPRHGATGESKLGKVYTFIGTKGGVGTTTLAVNFASVLAQRKLSTVAIDLDWIANDVAMQVGAALAYVGLANLDRVAITPITETLGEGLPPARGKARIVPMLRFLDGVAPAGRTSLAAAVRGFLARHREFSVQPPAEMIKALGERSYIFGKAARLSDEGILMSPRTTETDGFFISVLLRRG